MPDPLYPQEDLYPSATTIPGEETDDQATFIGEWGAPTIDQLLAASHTAIIKAEILED